MPYLGGVESYLVKGSSVHMRLDEIGGLNGKREEIEKLITCESGYEEGRTVWTARRSIRDLTRALDGAGLTREN